MNQDVALKILGQIMPWDDERAREEFAWLKLMARLKYDGYRDFHAGMRFIESLANWLQQFEKGDREEAYAFVRNKLVYIGPNEIQKLVEQFYPHTVRGRLALVIASELNIPLYRVLVNPHAQEALDRLRRQTLFMGLSDGARIDTIRHVNSPLLSNEQLVQGTQVDAEKWQDLLDNLRRELSEPCARFRLVYLVDDFTATGTSFLRRHTDGQTWKGKLCRFRDSVIAANQALGNDYVFDDDWHLCIHYYIGSSHAKGELRSRLGEAADIFGSRWAKQTHTSFGMLFPQDLPIDRERDADFVRLTDEYYDPILRTRHTDVGGAEHLGLGYGACALPVVLEHNTPNNSIALLWADTVGGDRNGVDAHPMRPLFRRRQRHV